MRVFTFLFIAFIIFCVLNAVFLALLSLSENSDGVAWLLLLGLVLIVAKSCS